MLKSLTLQIKKLLTRFQQSSNYQKTDNRINIEDIKDIDFAEFINELNFKSQSSVFYYNFDKLTSFSKKNKEYINQYIIDHWKEHKDTIFPEYDTKLFYLSHQEQSLEELRNSLPKDLILYLQEKLDLFLDGIYKHYCSHNMYISLAPIKDEETKIDLILEELLQSTRISNYGYYFYNNYAFEKLLITLFNLRKANQTELEVIYTKKTLTIKQLELLAKKTKKWFINSDEGDLINFYKLTINHKVTLSTNVNNLSILFTELIELGYYSKTDIPELFNHKLFVHHAKYQVNATNYRKRRSDHRKWVKENPQKKVKNNHKNKDLPEILEIVSEVEKLYH